MSLTDLLERWRTGEADLAPITRLLGIRPISFESGKGVVEMDAGPAHHNAMGTVHGGVLLDLADVAMGVAVATTLAAGETFSSLQSSINYVRPVREDRITAEASVVHRGRTTCHVDCLVRDRENRLVARVTSVCAIRSATS